MPTYVAGVLEGTSEFLKAGPEFVGVAGNNKFDDVKFVGAVGDAENQVTVELCFQVADVRKPLVAVERIAAKGNLV